MITVTLKDDKTLSRIVGALSRKRKAFLHRRDHVEVFGTHWDGGSRSVYYLVNIATGAAEPVYGSNVDIEPGFAVVVVGTFCGKPATPSVTVRNDESL